MSAAAEVTGSLPPVTAAAPAFLKGHGTQNDFIVLLDPEGTHGLSERQARALCDRRQGLGADGVLRAVPAESGGWFMDYRNADGSVAEMCGNGARVFALALRDAGLVLTDELVVQTRGGDRPVRFAGDEIVVGMGAATTSHRSVTVNVGREEWAATSVWVPNPHAVAFVDDLADAGPLTHAPGIAPSDAFPGRGQRRVRGAAHVRPDRDAGARAGSRRDAVLRHRCGGCRLGVAAPL